MERFVYKIVANGSSIRKLSSKCLGRGDGIKKRKSSLKFIKKKKERKKKDGGRGEGKKKEGGSR